MNKLIGACLLVLVMFTSFGQVADTSYYPDGKIKQIKVSKSGKITQATVFKQNGEVKYQWNVTDKTLFSFDAITYEDTLAEYFKTNYPDYILRQHYGNGPLVVIENYKNGKRDGSYEMFAVDGKPISKGQFKEWEKVGTWSYYDSEGKRDRQIHWFHHGFYEEGISIDNTIIPVAVTLLFIAMALVLCFKYLTFSYFYISYCLVTIGVFSLLYLTGTLASEQTLADIRKHIGNYFFPVLTTLVLVMAISSATALFFKRRTGVKTFLAILFLFMSLVLGYLLMGAYISSKLSGVMLG